MARPTASSSAASEQQQRLTQRRRVAEKVQEPGGELAGGQSPKSVNSFTVLVVVRAESA
jgi:hypothetical protein